MPSTFSALERCVVSPYTGEWIEIYNIITLGNSSSVSPYTGEWIEISAITLLFKWFNLSHLTQVSGLKF